MERGRRFRIAPEPPLAFRVDRAVACPPKG